MVPKTRHIIYYAVTDEHINQFCYLLICCNFTTDQLHNKFVDILPQHVKYRKNTTLINLLCIQFFDLSFLINQSGIFKW